MNEFAETPFQKNISGNVSLFKFSIAWQNFTENMPIWTEVLALHAVDPDDAQMLVKYAITDGDGMGSFSIDSEGKTNFSSLLMLFFILYPRCFILPLLLYLF